MGRPRKPTAMKIAEGNPGNRPLPENEIIPVSGLPEPPLHLTGYALEEWHRLAVALHGLQLFWESDAAVFAAYCESYGIWREASEERLHIIEEKGAEAGLLMTTSTGSVIQHPLLGIMNVARRDMLKYAQEFGLTPVARARMASLGIMAKEKKSKFGDLLNGGKA